MNKMTRKDLIGLLKQVQSERDSLLEENEKRVVQVRELSAKLATVEGTVKAANDYRARAEDQVAREIHRAALLKKMTKVAINLLAGDSIYGDDE